MGKNVTLSNRQKFFKMSKTFDKSVKKLNLCQTADWFYQLFGCVTW